VSNKPARSDPMARVAEPAPILNRLGLTTPMLSKIGAIAVLASTIQHETEMTVTVLGRHGPVDKRHSIEGHLTGDWIQELAHVGSSLPPGEFKDLIVQWCQAAESAFRCWNSIVQAMALDAHNEWAMSLKHLRRHGEKRKREPSALHVGEQSLALMEQVFAVLYRVVVTIEWVGCQRNMEVAENTAKTLLSALREARSVSRMFEDLAAASSDEHKSGRTNVDITGSLSGRTGSGSRVTAGRVSGSRQWGAEKR
jgi:hypothetical protein